MCPQALTPATQPISPSLCAWCMEINFPGHEQNNASLCDCLTTQIYFSSAFFCSSRSFLLSVGFLVSLLALIELLVHLLILLLIHICLPSTCWWWFGIWRWQQEVVFCHPPMVSFPPSLLLLFHLQYFLFLQIPDVFKFVLPIHKSSSQIQFLISCIMDSSWLWVLHLDWSVAYL